MPTKKILFLGSDHAAFEEKAALILLLSNNFDVRDLGTHTKESCAYPTYAKSVAIAVLANQEECCAGILLCGSGLGVSMVANRYPGIRAARCLSVEDARLAKEHNDANILCFGSRVSKVQEMLSMIQTWSNAKFAQGRHAERIALF
jgi:ribose 5-phosphate isomerase B